MKQFGSFALDTANECLRHGNERISVPPKPFGVLRYLVEHPGRLVSHDELLDALWPETYVQPQVLRTYVNDLRNTLDDDARNPRYIESVPKRGYRFIATVRESESADAILPLAPSVSYTSIAGRELELTTLRKFLQSAASGQRQVVFITGEAGIGKSALIEEFIRQSADRACIAHGQCIPGFSARQDYYPVFDALRRLACNDSAFAPLPAGALAPLDLCIAIEQIPQSQPLLLVLEDIQYADEATLQLISAMARRRDAARLMIVATMTAQHGSSSRAIEQIMHELRLRHLCSELCLTRLGRTAIAALLRAQLSQSDLPDGLGDFMYRHSEGNPRFAIAILEHLIAEKLLVQSGAGEFPQWHLRAALESDTAPVPAELARMIELEIEHLPPDEQKLLEAASLTEVAFPAWSVAAALVQDAAETEEACDELARRVSFVKRAGQDELPDGTRSAFYVFAHSLYREVLYQRQSPARRAVRHVRLANRLREMFRDREELIAREAAAHYEAACDWTNAVAMLRLAHRRALDLRAFGEAEELERQIARLCANLPLAQGPCAGQGLEIPPPRPVDRPASRFSN